MDLSKRTKVFALRIMRLYSALNSGVGEAKMIGHQLLRSGTSIGAQYREAMYARSKAEFVSKFKSALQELEETIYWFELLIEGNLISNYKIKDLFEEAQQLKAIFITSITTAQSKSSV